MSGRICDNDMAEDFFPDATGSKGQAQTEDAKRICNTGYYGGPCPVRAQCYEFAQVNRFAWGVFGGVAAKDRREDWDNWPVAPHLVDSLYNTAGAGSQTNPEGLVRDQKKVEQYRDEAARALDVLRTRPPKGVAPEKLARIRSCIEVVEKNPQLLRAKQAQLLGLSRTVFIEHYVAGLRLAGVSDQSDSRETKKVLKAAGR